MKNDEKPSKKRERCVKFWVIIFVIILILTAVILILTALSFLWNLNAWDISEFIREFRCRFY